MDKKSILVVKGKGGFGGPLEISTDSVRNKVLSMTASGIHPVTQKIAQLLEMEIVDGFKSAVADEEIAVVIIDCGGTARCGVYPKKKILTINVNPVGQSGPLAKFIVPEYYVSDVGLDQISISDGGAAVENVKKEQEAVSDEQANMAKPVVESLSKKPENYAQIKKEAVSQAAKKSIILRIGQGAGFVVGKFYEAGRETISMVMNNVLPFMAFVSMLIGIILASGLGKIIAENISPFAGSIGGLLLISVVCALPFLSPILGPGAVIAQVVGTLVGSQIGEGAIPVELALPALFAINPQVGCDFVPVGLSLGEAQPETIEFGVPAIFYSRLITGPLSVVIAYAVALVALKG